MLRRIFYFLTISFLAISAFAIEETQLSSRFLSQLLPDTFKEYKRGKFEGLGHVQINYYFREVENSKGVLIIAPGQSEAALKYSEFLYDLKDSGYSIFIIDHRGQGESGRLLPDPVKSHVDQFSDYVTDFETFINTVVHPEKYRKSVIVGHSMGGAIAAGYLEAHPNAVTAAVLSAPMLEIDTGFFGGLGADIVANLLKFAGLGSAYAPTQKPFDPNAKFENDIVTTSRARFDMKMQLYNAYPQLRVGGATVNWVRVSLEYTTALRQKSNVFQIPTLILQAGNDHMVKVHGENEICGYSPNNCSIFKFPASKHEILMETDTIRNLALSTLLNFIQSVGN